MMETIGTHFPILAKVIANTRGYVCEMGCGDYSTPMLHELCHAQKRHIYTMDGDLVWLEKYRSKLKRDWHDFIYVPLSDSFKRESVPTEEDWESWKRCIPKRLMGVVFIDFRPCQYRNRMIHHMLSCSEYLVVHDTQEPTYCWEYPEHASKFIYDFHDTQTTVLSDERDLSWLKS